MKYNNNYRKRIWSIKSDFIQIFKGGYISVLRLVYNKSIKFKLLYLYSLIQLNRYIKNNQSNQMCDLLPVHTAIQLTQQLIKQLTYEQQTFQEQSKKSTKEFDTSNDLQYYILSTKFIRQWKNMVSEALSHSAPTQAKKSIITPQLMNQQLVELHLKDFNEIQLKKQIQEGVDFMFYNYATMKVFQRYSGTKIPRRAYYSGVDKKVQMYPIKFQFVYMSKSWADVIHKNQDIQLPVLTSIGYKNQTILELLYRLVQFSKKDPRNRQSTYQNNAAAKAYFCLGFDPKQYIKQLKSKLSSSGQIQGPGDEINSNKIIGDLEIPSTNFVLVIQLQQQKWVYKAADVEKQRCEFCRQVKKLPVECRCKQVKYCGEQCKQKDWKYHARTCETQYQQDNLQPAFTVKQNSRLGLVGLSNLGNTCYMNAALQCMIHTKQLTQYFVSKRYLSEINQTNPIGSKGKLIKSYAKFIDAVISTQQQSVTPSRLKYAIGKTKQMFMGYQQHDSQQFLLFMLDTLHQDLNRVIQKPYTSGVQNQGRPDNVVAKQSWITYLKRNQSIINDLMGGQYRSQVKCPDCNNISVTFDPYLIFAVPIPTTEARQINLYYFFSNYKNQTIKMTLTSKDNTVQELREGVASKSKTEPKQILFFVSGFNGSVRKVQQNETVDKLTNQKQLNQNSQEKQLFAMQFEPQQLQNLGNKKFLTFKFVTKLGRTLAFKRPFPLQWKKLKGSDIYRRACQFLLNFWSKSEKLQGKERQTKLQVYQTKVLQQKIFKILFAYGKPSEIKNKLIYDTKLQIQQNTNVTQLLQKYNFQGQFQVQFAEDPYFSFNSYKSHSETSSSPAGHYDYSEGPKIGNDQSYTLEQCLNQMKKSEKLVEGNEVFCSKCQDLKLAQKKMQLYKASKYLVLQLRRFKQVGYEKMKNYAQVKFPFDLDLTNHIISPSAPENYFIDDQQFFIKPKYWTGYDKSTQTKYRLYGVVNHHGGLGGGHYTAFGLFKQKWYKFDDKHVSEVKPEQVVTSAAYLLFYERL